MSKPAKFIGTLYEILEVSLMKLKNSQMSLALVYVGYPRELVFRFPESRNFLKKFWQRISALNVFRVSCVNCACMTSK